MYDKTFIKWPSLLAAKHNLPAANKVPLADPNVDTVIDNGITQAMGPSARIPKVYK
jgi:hypothetical protein